MTKEKIVVIVGQTATGKSALAAKLAKKINGEIISADSRQVYKDLDIGTGKITKKEMSGVPHHLLDVANPKRKFTVVDFKKLAMTAAAVITKQGKIPIIVGGTGFYIDALVRGEVYPEVPPSPMLRKELSKKSTESLLKILSKLDPNRAKSIDAKNPVRLIRAIEIAKALGKVPNIIQNPPPYDFIKIGIKVDEETLKKKIEKRVKQMFADGLLNEIKKLRKNGISQKRLKEFGFEYDNPTEEKVILGSLQYAKRQNTYFKRDSDIKWFTLSEAEGFTPKEYTKIEKYIKKKY
jgi:tRNA dimethylallyltransferase